jgi:predicted outer membrane repeat protein
MSRTWRGRRTARLHLEHLEDRSVPSTFTVNTTLDELVPGDGKVSLREAIMRANSDPGADTIGVPAGVFKLGFGGQFSIGDGVTIQGGGAGLTIVDGQQVDRVFEVLGGGSSSIKVILQGLTIRNGNAIGDGGGILVGNADLVIRDCAVTGNRASLTGGGISNSGAPGTGDVTVVRTIVSRNVAGAGGGLAIYGTSQLTAKDSTVRRNLSGSEGGGIRAATVMLTNSTVSGNSAATNGGGISTTTATLTNSTVSGNSAGNNGGGIYAGTPALTNSTVSGNSAGNDGGGIYAATPAVTNSTVSGNSAATDGGGIWAASATLLNCTVVENSAHTGGGVFRFLLDGTFSVRNTIVALNLVDFTGTDPDVSGSFTSPGHNLIGDGTGGTGFTNGVNGDIVGTNISPIDPKLGPLAMNGGKTKTHALLAGSLAIDHGDNTGVPATDQRGLPRKKDGNGDGSARVDIGAFER